MEYAFLNQLAEVPLGEAGLVTVASGDTAEPNFTIDRQLRIAQPRTKNVQNQSLSTQQIAEILDPVYVVTSTKTQKVCQHHIAGNCRLGQNCPFIHIAQ